MSVMCVGGAIPEWETWTDIRLRHTMEMVRGDVIGAGDAGGHMPPFQFDNRQCNICKVIYMQDVFQGFHAEICRHNAHMPRR